MHATAKIRFEKMVTHKLMTQEKKHAILECAKILESSLVLFFFLVGAIAFGRLVVIFVLFLKRVGLLVISRSVRPERKISIQYCANILTVIFDRDSTLPRESSKRDPCFAKSAVCVLKMVCEHSLKMITWYHRYYRNVKRHFWICEVLLSTPSFAKWAESGESGVLFVFSLQ